MYDIISLTDTYEALFYVNTENAPFLVHIRNTEKNIMMDLCRAIVKIERQHITITSVQKVCADGHRPRVAFRQSREYKAAQEERAGKILPAIYTSYWESGAEFSSACKLNYNTRRVFDIQNAGTASNNDICIGETVTYRETVAPVCDIDEILLLSNDPLAELTAIKEEDLFWWSSTGKDLETEIARLSTEV